MALSISATQVYETLLPWFGTGFLEQSAVVSSTAHLLQFFYDKSGNYSLLLEKIEKHLFMSFYQWSKGTMEFWAGSKPCRIHSSTFPTIADDVLALYLLALRPGSLQFEFIKRYSMENQSLAALRALYINYSHFQSPQECAVIRRMITGIYPTWRYEKWLPPIEP